MPEKSPVIEGIRQAVLSRDNHKCIECGGTDELNVHHVLPEKYGGKYTPENLITLCRTCHSTKHIEYQTGYFLPTVYKIYNRFRLILQLPLKHDYTFVLSLIVPKGKFRKYQKEIIDNVMAGKDVLAVMATGTGKSVCFQIPGILLENQTLVITPLKTLMKDQVEGLWRKRIPATFINSDLDKDEKERRLDLISKKMFRFIYVAPEQFFNKDDSYSLKLQNTLFQNKYDLLVVDEAHCIVEWGRSFRPSYALLNKLKIAIGNPRTIALTASASKEAQSAICRSLGLIEPKKYVTGFFRPEIALDSKTFPGNIDQVINQKLDFISQFINEHQQDKIIIFVPTIKTGRIVWKELVKKNVNTDFFSSRSHIDDKIRIQDEYKGIIKSNLKVLICTSVFGMGVDISDIRFAIHWNIPENIEGYYQQMGRIGRDHKPSKAILLYGTGDEGLIRYITEKSLDSNPKGMTTEEKNIVKKVQEHELQTMLGYVKAPNKWKYILDYFGETTESKSLAGLLNKYGKLLIPFIIIWLFLWIYFGNWFLWFSIIITIFYNFKYKNLN